MALKSSFFLICNGCIQKDSEIRHQCHFFHKGHTFFHSEECIPSDQFQLGADGYNLNLSNAE